MVRGCGFAGCDKAGAVASISPAAMPNKYTSEVGLNLASYDDTFCLSCRISRGRAGAEQ